MKRLFLISAVAVMALSFTGCVQMHMDSVIEKDGSGTIAMTMSLSQVVTESMDEMKAMDMGEDMDGMDVLLSTNKDELQKQVKEYGVKVKKFSSGIVDGKQTVEVVMDFEDIKGMSFAMHALTREEGGGLGITDNGDGTFTLQPVEYDWPELPAEEPTEIETEMPQMDPEQMGKQMELMGKLMSSLSELDISMKITVPGEVVESNAPTVEGRTSIWTINQANMMSAGGDMEPIITFDGKGLKLKASK